jgi:hypothetical protein
MDMSVTYPINHAILRFLPEYLSVEPSISLYDVGTFSPSTTRTRRCLNSVSAGGTLNQLNAVNDSATGITGTNNFPTLSAARYSAWNGNVRSECARSAEFGLKINF